MLEAEGRSVGQSESEGANKKERERLETVVTIVLKRIMKLCVSSFPFFFHIFHFIFAPQLFSCSLRAIHLMCPAGVGRPNTVQYAATATDDDEELCCPPHYRK